MKEGGGDLKNMDIILWIVLGGLAGWIASLIMGTREGIVMDIIVGILGALVGGFLMGFFGQSGVNGFNVYSLVVAVIGAVVLLAIYRALRRTA